MHRLPRILLVVVILLCGAAIAPSLALPSQSINWQLYADAYEQPETIESRDFTFAPNVIIVPVGTTVRRTNDGAVDHTVTSDTPLFSKTLSPGDSFEYRFDVTGTFAYHCAFHPNMTGKVIVTDQVSEIYIPLISRNTP